MKIKQNLYSTINSYLRKIGYEFRSVKKNRLDISMSAALSRRASMGLKINTVIDIGASNGSWSKMAQQYFPDAFYFLVEASGFHVQSLQAFKSEKNNVDYVIAAAGDSIGEVYFDSKDPFGGQASHTRLTSDYITVPVTTIDEQVIVKGLQPPFALKLDTHGFEVPILKGAQNTIKDTHLIVIETYNFKLTPDSLKFWEMCSYLEALGFRSIDLCDPMHRPKDQAFWQIDLFFIPDSNFEFKSNSYT